MSQLLLDTGPPSGGKRRTLGTQPPRVLKHRRRAAVRSENAPRAVGRQVGRVDLVALRLALSPNAWAWLRWKSERRAA
jgi:hypothetical protein